MKIAGLTLVAILLAVPAHADDVAYPIAGEKPDARPEAAPLQRASAKGADWYARALTGVSQPYPLSLRFLEDQGAWYIPFAVPGMTGPYDIRNWHAFSR